MDQMAEEEGQKFVMKNNKYSRVNHNILPGFVVDSEKRSEAEDLLLLQISGYPILI